MNRIEIIEERYPDDTFIKLDDLDDAIIGFSHHDRKLIYSVDKILKILGKDMTEDEAIEYYEFNIAGLHIGDDTPILCEDI